MSPIRYWSALSLGVVLNCRVVVSESTQQDAGRDPPIGTSSGDPFVCPEWENRTPSDVESLVREAIAELEQSGTRIDSSVWGDEARFSALMDRVYLKAGCPLPDDPTGSALSSSDAPAFCGVGQGSPALWRPTVDPCVNRACRAHDACYAMCNSRLRLTCYWSATTSECDDPFVREAEQCELTEHRFASLAVIGTANVINAVPLPGCAPTECPAFREAGAGPCSIDTDGASCRQCEQRVDPTGCWEDCEDDAEHQICVAARCANAGECFGGYGRGTPDDLPQLPDAGVVDAQDAGVPATGVTSGLWRITLIDAAIPLTKTDGAPWDVGDEEGIGAPDVIVSLVASSFDSPPRSTTAQDEYYPSWNEPFPSVQADSMLSLVAEVVDEDVVFNDPIGFCWVRQEGASGFRQGLQPLVCDPSDLEVAVDITMVDL